MLKMELSDKLFDREKLTLKEKIEVLEDNIDSYRGDYGTLENRVEDTFNLILGLLKDLVEKASDGNDKWYKKRYDWTIIVF